MMDRLKDWNLFYKKLSSNSSNVKSCIIDSFKEENINLKINSIDTMISYKFNFNDFNERESSALLIDSLVEKKYLTSSTIYPNICHTNNENKKFKKMLKDSLLNLKEKISRSSEDTKSYLNNLGYLEKGFSRTQKL